LFAQCRGRDLWLSKSLFFDLVLRAAALGTGVALLLGAAPPESGWERLVSPGLVFPAITVLLLILAVTESAFLPDTEHVKRALHLMHTKYDKGNLSMVVLALSAGVVTTSANGSGGIEVAGVDVAVALGLAAFVMALFVREKAWIRAGQAVPIS
jgi:hypothetical protein